MTEILTPPDGSVPVPQPSPVDPPDGALPDFSTLPPIVQEHIKGLRKEAEKYRNEKKDAEKARQKEETARLEAEKQWEQLAQQRASRLNELEPLASEVEELRQFLQSQLERRIAALPAQWRSAVPEYENPRKTLDWLDKNEANFRLPSLVKTDAGIIGDRGGQQTGKIPMTPEYLAAAKKMNKSIAFAQAAWDEDRNQ